MFIAALFIIARAWKQPRCPSADEWIRKVWYIYTMEYYSTLVLKTLLGDFPGGPVVKNPPSRMGGRDSLGVWDGHVHTAIFKMHNQQGFTVQHMEFCSMLCGSLDGRGVWRRMDTCVYVWLKYTLHCSPENITTLLIGYIPKQNKKFKKLIIISR